MKANKGFTLIELVVVIVILGILAAVAMPKFMDLSGTAHDVSTQGVAAAISSGSAVNYGKYQAAGGVTTTSGPFAVTGVNTAVCTGATLGNLISGSTLVDSTVSTLPTGAQANSTFKISAGTGNCSGTGAVGAGGTVTCGVAPWSGSSATQTATVTCTN